MRKRLSGAAFIGCLLVTQAIAMTPTASKIAEVSGSVAGRCTAARQTVENTVAQSETLFREGAHMSEEGKLEVMRLERILEHRLELLASPVCDAIDKTEQALIDEWGGKTDPQTHLDKVKSLTAASQNCAKPGDELKGLQQLRAVMIGASADRASLADLDAKIAHLSEAMIMPFCRYAKQDKAHDPILWRAEQCLLFAREVGTLNEQIAKLRGGVMGLQSSSKTASNADACTKSAAVDQCIETVGELNLRVGAEVSALIDSADALRERAIGLSCPPL